MDDGPYFWDLIVGLPVWGVGAGRKKEVSNECKHCSIDLAGNEKWTICAMICNAFKVTPTSKAWHNFEQGHQLHRQISLDI
jgi:hypothetical protein